jgi:hypothetical protein
MSSGFHFFMEIVGSISQDHFKKPMKFSKENPSLENHLGFKTLKR